MPLAFESLSHGSIAFGFFNIESDMLLCDRYFLFAEDFCNHIVDMTAHVDAQIYQTTWRVWLIEAAEDIGDLMGAIHGLRFTGFIGELYGHYPFPGQPAAFKQNPEGHRTQSLVTDIISKYAQNKEIQIIVDNKKMETVIGSFRFNRIQFQELLIYVWRGGYPRWKNEIRPGYVLELKRQILLNPIGIFEHITFGD
jgi:hypothetical protein